MLTIRRTSKMKTSTQTTPDEYHDAAMACMEAYTIASRDGAVGAAKSAINAAEYLEAEALSAWKERQGFARTVAVVEDSLQAIRATKMDMMVHREVKFNVVIVWFIGGFLIGRFSSWWSFIAGVAILITVMPMTIKLIKER